MTKQPALGKCSRSPSSSRPAEYLPAPGSSRRDGSGAALSVEDGNKPGPAVGSQAGAGDRRAAGQGMSARKRDRQPARHAANT